ncbi:hypothetical protein [Streptomyces sp. Tu102]|uniref:hypothetical protein n=1 Tax=Streptomyces TaxID=1883 RepID=UPI001BDCAC98|nr:hypothetical protein [Streptomyces sp. Tu102]MBT1094366.1 hypothetical protein [Streptomyces sp. Tu102]
MTVVLGGILLLAGCQESSSPRAGADTPSSSSPSLTGSPSPSSSSAATGKPARSAVATTAPATAARTPTPTSTKAAAATPTRAPATPASRPGCRNLAASVGVKAAVTEAYRQAFPRFVHVQPAPDQFFYGQCDGVRYAATRFQATPGATQEELVGMQDEGSVTKYFRSATGSGWSYLTSDAFPRGAHGCDDVPAIPEGLSAAWGNCAM